MSNLNDEEETYLKIGEVVPQEEAWAQIGDNGELAYINWEKIEQYAVDYDRGQRHQTFVICKLLSLVRRQVKESKDK